MWRASSNLISALNNRTELTAASVWVFESEAAIRASLFSAPAAHPDRWGITD